MPRSSRAWTGPWGIAVDGSDLFVVNNGNGTIGEYTTSGAVVNASLISGLNDPMGIAIVVPELSSLTLLGLALAGLVFCARRKTLPLMFDRQGSPQLVASTGVSRGTSWRLSRFSKGQQSPRG